MAPFERKKKEMTAAEAIDASIKERTPYWFGSPPLFTGLIYGKHAGLHPLDETFTEKNWLLYIVDPTTVPGENAMRFIHEYHARYDSFGLNTILVLRTPYKPWLDRRTIERYLEKKKMKFPIVLDNDDTIASGVKLKEYPKFVFIHQGKIIHEKEGPNWFRDLEIEFHQFLRASEPGLPLATFYDPGALPNQVAALELGKGKGVRLIEKSTLLHGPDGNKRDDWIMALEKNMVALSGDWKQTDECVHTQDSRAQLTIRRFYPSIGVLAQTLTSGGEMCKSIVEVEGQPVIDIFSGSDLRYDERGQSHLEVRTLQLRLALSGLTERENEISIRFPFAKQTPIAIYGFRFGN